MSADTPIPDSNFLLFTAIMYSILGVYDVCSGHGADALFGVTILKFSL